MKIYICCKEKKCSKNAKRTNIEVRDWTQFTSNKCAEKIKILWKKHWDDHNAIYVIRVSKRTFKELPSRFSSFRLKKKDTKKDLFVEFQKKMYILFLGTSLHDLNIKPGTDEDDLSEK